MSESRLIELSYFDPKSKVRLTAYADTIMVDRDNSTITAIRFGGYPDGAAVLRSTSSNRRSRSPAGQKM